MPFYVRALVPAFLAFLFALPASAQPDLWTAHTSMRRVQALSAAPDAVWAATTGGIFRYGISDGAFLRFTVTDGLHSIQARAIAFDARRNTVWIGYADGVVDRLMVENESVRTLRDIARATRFSSREVNRIVVRGDSVFVATGFGVVVFDPVRLEVRDTYSQLGTLTPAIAARDVTVAPAPQGGPALWIATDEGLAYARLDGRNLQDPASWSVETQGLPVRDVRSLAVFNGKLYAGTANDLAVRETTGWRRLFASGTAVSTLTPTPERLLGVDQFGIVAVELDGTTRRFQENAFLNPRGVASAGGRVWIGDDEAGLVRATLGTSLTFDLVTYPPGPEDGVFNSLSFAPDGTLWAAGNSANGAGLYRLTTEGEWTSFTPRTVPEMNGRGGFMFVHVGPNGSVWGGTGIASGNGLGQIAPDGTFTRYSYQNSTLRRSGTAGPPEFIRAEGAATEPDGTLWVTNLVAPNPLHVRTPDGTWTAIPPFTSGGFSSTYNAFEKIIVDSFGGKWIVVRSERDLRQGRGVAAYSSGANPTDSSDDAVRLFDQPGANGQGLPSTNVLSIVEDRDGRIWVGTSDGPAYLINNGIAARDNTANFVWPTNADREGRDGVYLLRGLRCNALAVDPANGIWVGTDNGAWLVQEQAGGFRIASHFTTQNSPLLADRVIAIAVHPRTGEVFFSTDRGLVSYRGGVAAPAARAEDLLVYPNPVRLEGGVAPEITIRGLVEQTQLRIMSPSGGLVARLDTRGGSVTWDGRDLDGRLVPSGMYLVVAVGRNGEGAAYGKIAVIR